MAQIQVGDVRLNVQELGQGPLLVMCHGLVFGSIATWYFSAASTLAQRYRVLLYDQRGHGKSELTASGYDLATQAADLAGLIEQVQGTVTGVARPPVTLVGHSYGALIALHYALMQPQRVARLVLIDAPLPACRHVYPSMASIDSQSALENLYPEALRGQLERGARAARRQQERLQTLFLHSSLRADVQAAGDIEDSRLAQLSVPVLCLYGRDSDCLSAGERLARSLPHARLELLDCGHYVPVEAPAAMSAALERFL